MNQASWHKICKAYAVQPFYVNTKKVRFNKQPRAQRNENNSGYSGGRFIDRRDRDL
jgi:hypothetical protein